jgi:hypothetical protein
MMQSQQLILNSGDSGASKPGGALPNDPGSNFKRPSPPLLDANRLLPPQVDDGDDDSSNSDSDITINNVDFPALYRATLRMQHGSDPPELAPDDNPLVLEGVGSTRYHWGGLFAQSLFFNVVENSFRIASDDQIRYLMAKKPFWHDWSASMKQFNMRRWNDGDDFLVNYVGHPMQGAVAAYIEIQNSPKDRQLQISATHEYWMSRFRGFLWALAYSTHSEISPLGEAGIGNEGGWTYPIRCSKPCANWNPHTMKSTNNTGWVDFTITPTVGLLWVLAEDTLDRYVSDRIQGTNQHSFAPMIIRGALNPSRSFANLMRLKKPWYRDFQHEDMERYRAGVHVLRSDEDSAWHQQLKRLSVAGYFRSMPLGTYANSCAFCGHGGGLETDYLLTHWLAASFALDQQQGLSTKNATSDGSALFLGFGVRLVYDRPLNTFSVAIRPGFVLDDVVTPAHLVVPQGVWIPETSVGTKHTAGTLLLSNDYKINKIFAVRASFGATVVRYRSPVEDPPGVGQRPYLSWMSHDNYSNHVTWVWQGGPVVRF